MRERLECAQVERRLWEYLDGVLPAEEAAAVRAHLEGCGGCGPACGCCHAFLALVARAREACGGAPPGLGERLRGRLAGEA